MCTSNLAKSKHQINCTFCNEDRRHGKCQDSPWPSSVPLGHLVVRHALKCGIRKVTTPHAASHNDAQLQQCLKIIHSYRVASAVLESKSGYFGIVYQHYDAYWWFLMHYAIMTNKTIIKPIIYQGMIGIATADTSNLPAAKEATPAPRKRLPRRLYCFFLARARSRRVFPSCRGKKKVESWAPWWQMWHGKLDFFT